jgi:hypothetical protein
MTLTNKRWRDFYKSTMEKTKTNHKLFLLTTDFLEDKIVEGVKKQESFEIQFDALNVH